MARISTLTVHDQHLGGAVTRYLLERRGEGVTYETLARELAGRFGITTTTSTVMRWCKQAERAA
jgi:intein-encoded DNA endonuclease-like protein